MNSAVQKNVNFPELMPRLLGLLSEKERDVIRRRFSLDGKKRETLDRIGKSYSITRERVRQIEAVAIKKLARISMDPSMRAIHELAFAVLTENGRVMSEDLLLSQMIKNLHGAKKIDFNSVKLAMRVSDKLVKQEKNQFFRAFWRTSDVPLAIIKNAIKDVKSVLSKKGDVTMLDEIHEKLKGTYSKEMVLSVLNIDWGFMETENGWGLKVWRFINPRSIKDKILISLKNIGHPLHFRDITSHVLQDFPSKKTVTPQAIHNELIRHPEFVLVGRGEYGLKEWGMVAGTVSDVIKLVFAEHNNGPISRQQIIEEVLKKREIRLGTISLNLQKYPCFKRVGRAMYEYDKSLEIPKRKRGRGAIKKV